MSKTKCFFIILWLIIIGTQYRCANVEKPKGMGELGNKTDASNHEIPKPKEQHIDFSKVTQCNTDSDCPKYSRCQSSGYCGSSCVSSCKPLFLKTCKNQSGCTRASSKCMQSRCKIELFCSEGFCAPKNCETVKDCNQKQSCPRCVNFVCRYGKKLDGCLSSKSCIQMHFCNECGNCEPGCHFPSDCGLPSSGCQFFCHDNRCVEKCGERERQD